MVGMGADDSNDNRGVGGECPGHLYRVTQVILGQGARMEQACVYCGAVSFVPSNQD